MLLEPLVHLEAARPQFCQRPETAGDFPGRGRGGVAVETAVKPGWGAAWEIWWYNGNLLENYWKYGDLWDLPSGNQTWLAGKWTIKIKVSDFPNNTFIYRAFSIAMFEEMKGLTGIGWYEIP